MTPESILTAYLILLFIQVLFSLGLTALNMAHVRRHAAQVPELFAKTIDPESYRRSIDYTLAKAKLAMTSDVAGALFLVLVILSGWFGSIDRWAGSYSRNPYVHGVIFVLSVSILFSLVDLPFKLYSVFVIEERFGFNKMTVRQFVSDTVKGLLLTLVLMTPLLCGIFWFMRSAGELWWVYAFLFVALFQVFILYLYPVVIAPIFNKFTPLSEGELREAIFSLAGRLGFKAAGISIMDGSRRSSHANAYFAGFGANKRIVLFDTLVAVLSTPQTVAVLAHEIGHEKRHHTKKLLLFSCVFTAIGFWVLAQLLNYTPMFRAFGFDGPSLHGALIVLSFAASPITFFLSPLLSVLSRRYEYQADRYAADAVGNARDLADALLALSKKSLSNLTPHPWYSFFHYSHPTLYERLSALARY